MEYWSQISPLQKLAGNMLYGVCAAIGHLPDRILYGCVSRITYTVIYRLLGYRRQVVRTNLSNSFPQMGDEELRRIEKGFYRHLSDVIVDTISMPGLSQKRLDRRIVYDNLDELMSALGGRSWLCALAHYGSWEFFWGFAAKSAPYTMLGIYRPLHSKAVDYFYHRLRSRFGARPTPMDSLIREVVDRTRRSDPFEIGLVCDQTPPFYEIRHWFTFLNQETPFFEGMERISVRYHLPVWFSYVTREPGSPTYHMRFEMLFDGDETVGQYEILGRYAARLERMICENPELWMWSHRRWKHKPGKEWQRVRSSY